MTEVWDGGTTWLRRRAMLGLGLLSLASMFGVSLPLTILAPVPASAAERPFRVFMVLWRGQSVVEQGFQDYFKNRGLKVEFTVRDAGQDRSRLGAFVEEIETEKPDLVYCWGTDATLGIVGRYDDPHPEKFVRDIPVLFTLVGNPLGSKVAPSLQHPGGNVTGVVHLVPIDVQLRAMQSYLPIKRLAVIYNPLEAYGAGALVKLRQLAAQQHIELVVGAPLDAAGKPSVARIPQVVAELAATKPDLLYIPATSFLGPNAALLTEAALAHNLPTFSATETLLNRGKALMGLVSPFYGVGQFAGYKAEQILVRKTPPADIPIETLTRFSFIINIQVAKLLDAFPPMTVLKYAQIKGG